MSPNQDQLTPTPFEPAARQSSTSSAPPASASGSPRWVVPALLALVAVALGVVFLLPQPSPDPVQPLPDTAGEPATQAAPRATNRDTKAPPESSPWADAQQAELRKEAQDALAELLELQRELEDQGAEQWAAEEFAAAIALAADGDALYREREYVAAGQQYQAALEGLQAIADSVPERLASQLEQARLAIEAGAIEAVGQHLEQAALLGPDSADLAALQARAERLPELLAEMDGAASAEASGDLAAAEAGLEQATKIDPEHQRAAAELARVKELHIAQRFNRAMSEGYAALDEGRYSAAREAFKKARGLRPNAAEVDSALAELQSTETAARLAGLRRQGEQLESAEDWKAAADSYQKALAIDASVVYAQEGLARAQPRAELQTQLEEITDKPERLSDPSVARATTQLLEKARAIQPQGPVLAGQIAEIDNLLAIANQPIAVTLRSDQQTAVTVYKVARLGQFSERQLELRPGTYTAVGTRNGYRDVRRTFTISPDTPPETVLIACTEPI
ncbi:hypothetical protein FV139_20280 [Parahaliea maris]|uniref:Tetratricopeptide repeat protein n=1 Tax=Parahaliea maris TaxID=2716870 RepID=A0A5C8ZNY7_9GAMM|nr:hypothetical protein [Parahaliea maris]TXS89277.1 hypothetical protein FV139_20280 [Parahaliea maris]